MPFELIAGGVAALLAAAGAIYDARFRLLPNWLCLALALANVVTVLAGQGWAALGSSALHALVAGVIGFALFSKGWIGGGDAKFYAAAALGVPFAQAANMLLLTSIFGLVLTLGLGIASVLRKPGEGIAAAKSLPIPFGVAIAPAFLAVTFGQQLLSLP